MDSEEEYKYYKYTEESSVNHPSIDKDLAFSYSSFKSHSLPSQIHSEIALNRPNEIVKTKSVFSEPIRKKPIISLTEEALAIHNSEIPPQPPVYQSTIEDNNNYDDNDDDDDDNATDAIMERVDERCRNIQLEFDEKIKQLEEQLTKTEQDYNQSRTDIEELNLMEKEYMDQGIQTDISNKEVEQLQQMENALQNLSLNPKEFKDQVNQWKSDSEQYTQTRKIIWDAPFVPVGSICRQLPTAVHLQDIEGDTDICEYHLDRYYKVKNRFSHEKGTNQNDYRATLTRLSDMVKQ